MSQHKVIYGFHAVMSVLEHHPEEVLALYCQEKEENARIGGVLAKAKTHQLAVEYLPASTIAKMTTSTHHQGIAAKVRSKTNIDENSVYLWLEESHAKPPLLLILEGIQDPHNLGACLRCADGLGVDWVILPKMNRAPLNATVSKVACGAEQTLPVVEIANVVRFIQQIQQRGAWVIGTSDKADVTLNQIDFKRPIAWVMGAEGKGLKRLTLDTCDTVTKIPLLGSVMSLNVSVATGICLYETWRQRNSV